MDTLGGRFGARPLWLMVLLVLALLVAAPAGAAPEVSAPHCAGGNGRVLDDSIPPPPDDRDCDFAKDNVDNCPPPPGGNEDLRTRNPNQADSDSDGVGDWCEADDDNDGVADWTDGQIEYQSTRLRRDNCRTIANADQADDNRNGVGNLCEFDTDRDGLFDTEDNCPTVANPDQSDLDNDKVGDVCDNDDDADYTRDDEDNCPLIPNPDQLDADADGIGAMCDDNDTPPPPPEPTATPATPGAGSDDNPNLPGGGAANVNDRQAPRVSLRVAFSPRVEEVQDGLVVRVTCSEACAAKAALTVTKATSKKLKLRSGLTTVGTGEASLEAASSTYAFVRFDARAKARLFKAKRTELALKLTITDPAGNTRRVSESLTLRR